MKAAYLQKNRIHVGEVPDPVPTKGQALVRTHSCGLCASDAHFLHSGSKVVEMSRKFGGPNAVNAPVRTPCRAPARPRPEMLSCTTH